MFTFRKAINEEYEQLFKLRFEIFNEKSWINPFEYEDYLEVDDYDQISVHFIAITDDKKIAGTIRIVEFTPERKLPILNSFSIDTKECPTDYVEISRLVIDKKYRGQDILNGLIFIVFLWCVDKKKRGVYAIMELKLFNYLKRIGYPFIKIGEGNYYSKNYKIPTYLSLKNAVEYISQHQETINKYNIIL